MRCRSYRNHSSYTSIGSAGLAGHMIGCGDYGRRDGTFVPTPPHMLSRHVPRILSVYMTSRNQPRSVLTFRESLELFSYQALSSWRCRATGTRLSYFREAKLILSLSDSLIFTLKIIMFNQLKDWTESNCGSSRAVEGSAGCRVHQFQVLGSDSRSSQLSILFLRDRWICTNLPGKDKTVTCVSPGHSQTLHGQIRTHTASTRSHRSEICIQTNFHHFSPFSNISSKK